MLRCVVALFSRKLGLEPKGIRRGRRALRATIATAVRIPGFREKRVTIQLRFLCLKLVSGRTMWAAAFVGTPAWMTQASAQVPVPSRRGTVQACCRQLSRRTQPLPIDILVIGIKT